MNSIKTFCVKPKTDSKRYFVSYYFKAGIHISFHILVKTGEILVASSLYMNLLLLNVSFAREMVEKNAVFLTHTKTYSFSSVEKARERNPPFRKPRKTISQNKRQRWLDNCSDISLVFVVELGYFFWKIRLI